MVDGNDPRKDFHDAVIVFWKELLKGLGFYKLKEWYDDLRRK